jgi:hypothetical protein
MNRRLPQLTWLLVAAGALVAVGQVTAEERTEPRSTATVPLDHLPAALRARVKQTLEHPTFFARGPAEVFACRPEMYYWLMDHPDRAVLAWRRLGAKCIEITDRGNGRFGWSDHQGSDVSWDTIYGDNQMRVWFAEGKVRTGALLPLVSVQVVVVLRYTQDQDAAGRTVMRHQAELSLFTDSRTAALVARLLGSSTQRMGEQYVGQLEMFYSALAWYLEQHPRAAEALLAEPDPSTAATPPVERPESLLRPAGGWLPRR